MKAILFVFVSLFICNSLICQDIQRLYHTADSTVIALEAEVNSETQQKNGDFKIFNEKGELIAHSEYKNDKIWNVYLIKDSLGNEITDLGTLKDGNGTMKVYDENYKLRNLVTFEDGIKNGLAIKYYRSGRKSMEGYYLDDNRCGTWFRFSDDEKNEITDTRESRAKCNE